MTWIVLALIPLALAISLPLTAVLIRAGTRLRTLDTPGSKGHTKELRRVPNIGGIAIAAAVIGPMLLGVILLQFVPAQFWHTNFADLAGHLDRFRETLPTALALIGCMMFLHVVGLIDDRRAMPATWKFLAQIAPAALMVIFFDVRLLTLLDGSLSLGSAPSILISILWIVLITNAINFLDNMDGLAAGVSAIASAFFLAGAILNAQWFIAASLALLIGALIGFLLFNFPPAKIFMGDGGSLVIGFLLAVLTARTTYYNPDAEAALGSAWYAVFMPVIVLAIPLYDFTTVTILRLSQGRSPFVGDQQHFSHRLVQRGLSKRGAVIVIWAATAVTSIGGIALGQLQPWQAALVGVQTVLILLMLAILEHASRHAAGRGSIAP